MKFLFLSLTILLSLPLLAKEKNVLFIVADDLNCALGPYEDQIAVTPNLDRLAARGVTFTRAYCQQAVCNPSRSSFLTGKYPDATGVDDLRKYFRTALPDVVTLPGAFLQAGYFTQCAGKIFHNMGETKDRASWSVDEYLFEGTHAADTVFSQMPKGDNPPTYKSPVTEAFDVPDTAYRDGRITEYALDSLARAKDRDSPFFLAVGYWRPHLPFVAPQKYWDLYDPLTIPSPYPKAPPLNVPQIALHPNRELHGYGLVPPGEVSPELESHLRHGYYASISFLDEQVGKLLDSLEENELSEDTIVVFTSDHGFHIGERGLWAKTTNFELDARVPLIVSDPAKPEAHGSTSGTLAELVDLIPTLTELAEVPTPPGQDGKSFAPALNDPARMIKEHAFTQHQHPFYGKAGASHLGYSVRDANWRYTEWYSIETGEREANELYDHRSDSLETENVAAAKPEIVSKLSKVLLEQYHP
ncbi:MAG: sulfatase [Verrucomicrobiales bacterium]|nr:sulfatase [Verrucomicrobiales bacterium]